MLDKLGSIFKKPPKLTDEQVRRNERRVAGIDQAGSAVAAHSRDAAGNAESEGLPPPYRTIFPAGSVPPREHSASPKGDAQCDYSFARLVGRDGKATVNDNWTANERSIAGWRAQWNSSVDQLYKENGHYYKRQEG